ncbi:hypothetical protein QNM97_10390 [Gordonia sp. L191]|uniref:hypothetical protein n=1 Tax=Gordonia sp. L191 TaxID=2982699 RepID=UPI0024BF2DAA|nr:hypothetical protein [Gordonia sp. L191]WHU49342.1 hypothetical protein QNM97_10390 [Gordonia sp. L191]
MSRRSDQGTTGVVVAGGVAVTVSVTVLAAGVEVTVSVVVSVVVSVTVAGAALGVSVDSAAGDMPGIVVVCTDAAATGGDLLATVVE